MLTLIVPGLIWTRQALADLTCDLPLPAFTTLLGRGLLRHLPPRSTAAVLADASGLTAPLPAAALRWLALREHPGADESWAWLCLDPVHLRLDQRSVSLDDPRQLRLSIEEAAALAVSLAPTFAGLGQLEVVSDQNWNLRLLAAAPVFQPLPEAVGRPASSLPQDAAYAPWRHALNEAQMVLHTHPVNQARAAAGKPVINSLWPWGGGRLPELGTPTRTPTRTNATAHDALWSNDPVARGIARLLQIEDTGLPTAYSGTAARAPLAVIDSMESPARTGDAIVWRDELSRFEVDWLVPALNALRSGRLDSLRLIAPGELAAAELQVRRRDLWKFWRKPGALAELVAQ